MLWGPPHGYGIARRIEQAAYSVSERRKASWIRMALGAQRKEVLPALERAFEIWFDGGIVDRNKLPREE
jgi:hypothetical protein